MRLAGSGWTVLAGVRDSAAGVRLRAGAPPGPVGDALRVELHSPGIQVGLIEPGSIATPIWDKSRGAADALTIPPELHEQYGKVPAALEKVLAETARRGISADVVAATIEKALTAQRMPARSLVGRDAKAMLLVKRLLPEHLFDRIVRARIGI